MSTIEELDTQINDLVEQAASTAQRLTTENPALGNVYFHPEVQALHDQIKHLVAERHDLYPDDHPEKIARASASPEDRDRADREIADARGRLGARTEVI